ncbi:glycoside hydrolase family 18 protein, partial [Piromyces sp. E2]
KKDGGRVIISFGGAFNDELALHHDSASSLAKEYKKVIEKYQPIRIDFDMEGTGLDDNVAKGRKAEEVHKLRAQALNIVRKELKDKMPSISLCLPVNPDVGFNDSALAVIKAMKNENVPIDNINIMAMDYGSYYKSRGFYENTINSLEKSYEQSRSIYPDVKMGVIPMIGQNDDGAILTLQDAERIVDYLKSKKYVNTVSMWSINRDKNDGEFSSLVKNTFINPKDKSYKKSYKYSSILKKFLN